MLVPEEVKLLGDGVSGAAGSPNMDVGKQTWIPWKSSYRPLTTESSFYSQEYRLSFENPMKAMDSLPSRSTHLAKIPAYYFITLQHFSSPALFSDVR